MKSPTIQTKFLKRAGHLLAAAAAGLLTVSSSKAATLTFSSPINITSDAVLDAPLSYPGATLIDAKKWGGSATAVTTSGAAQVINFTQGTTANADTPGTSTTTILYNVGTQTGAALFPGTTGNADLDTVLRCNGWHNNGSDAVRPLCLRLGGLTIGTKYVVSLFTADARSTDRTQQYYDTFAAGVFSGGASASFSQNPANIVLATFTADAATQDIFVRETDGVSNDDTHLVGFTLYSVTAFAPAVGDISISPSNTAYAGESRILSAGATGPITGYRWEWDSGTFGVTFSVISGAGSTSYTQNTTGLLGDYQYRFVATNASSSATSAVATLTVNAATIPFVVTDTTPASWAGYTTLGVTFSAAFDGNHPIAYQWQVDKGSGYTNILEATNASLALGNLQLGDAGNYQLTATNSIGGAVSSPAALTVGSIASAKYTWQTPVPFNGLNADQILTNLNGAFVGAAAFGNTASQVTLGNGRILDFSTDGSIATATGAGTSAGAYPGVTTVSTTNAGFDAVLNRFSYDAGPKTINLNNLQIGETYSVQLFALDDRGGDISARLANFQDPADAGDVSATFAMGDNVYVVGTFVAANTTETIHMNLPTANNGSLNALVLRALSFTPPNQPPTVVGATPATQTVYQGRTASFTVSATSYVTPTYVWQAGPVGGPYTNLNNGGVISGADTNVLTLTPANSYNGAEFQCIVSNPAGNTPSSPGTVSVLPLPSASGAGGANIVALNPVAYWPLNETADPAAGGLSAYDAAGVYDGTYLTAAQNAFNGITGVDAAGGFPLFNPNAGALRSTGNTDQSWVTTPALNLNTNTVTIGMWIYPEGAQTAPAGLYVNRNAGTVAGLGYYATDRLGYKWNNDASETWGFSTGPLIPTDMWSFVAVVIEPTQATLYLYNANGLQTAVNTTTHNNQSWGGSRSNIRIGCDNSPATAFNGKIDEVAVFNRALSQSEVLQLAGAPVAPTLSIETVGSQVRLTWSSGTLLEAPSVTGPWTTNVNASPYLTTPAEPQKFFRVQVP